MDMWWGKKIPAVRAGKGKSFQVQKCLIEEGS
jgi:hypothetical protein